MILKETLRVIAKSQRKDLIQFETGVKREKLKEIEIKVPFAIVLSGIRRCGKSTLLRQAIKNVKEFYYFNFEDPRATNFEVNDFQKLDDVFAEEYGKQNYYFLDEIQNAAKWELFVRAGLDKNKHFIITGSNASLLSKELGTRLTGRHIRYELFPFSYQEFLKLMKKEPNISSFQEYFIKGGFPDYLKIGKAEILQELLNDIIIRDIASRYSIRNQKILKEMAIYLITNVGKRFTYNKIAKTFGLAANSAITFISHFEDCYLLFVVPQFHYSLKKQLISPKKVYSIDNGLSNVNSVSFSEDKGGMLENVVFVNLRRKYREIFYFQEISECDFIIKDGTKIAMAIQSCYDLNEENKERELNGLLEALNKFKLDEGLIITYNQEDEIRIKNKIIRIIPAWKWMLA